MSKKYVYLSIEVAILALLVTVKLLLPADVYACKCAPTDSIKVEATDSEAVFTGRVTQVEPSVKTHRIKATFAVLESFKGVATKIAVVETEEDSTACGYEFRKGENYLVYAYGSGKNLGVSLCSRTRILSQANGDLTVLRQLSPGAISKVNVGPSPHGPTVFPLGWPVLLVALLEVVAILSVAVMAGLLVIRLVKPAVYKVLISRHGQKSHVIILLATVLILFVVLLFGLGWLERLLK